MRDKEHLTIHRMECLAFFILDCEATNQITSVHFTEIIKEFLNDYIVDVLILYSAKSNVLKYINT